MNSADAIQTIITDYASHAEEIRHIRDQVFLKEQQIDPVDEFDDRDAKCVFALAFANGSPVGTGRLDLEKDGKVGRVAVLQQARRRGVGREMMRAIESHAREVTRLEKIWFHAQRSAVAFYLALDYEIASEEFFEANIPHVLMQKAIR